MVINPLAAENCKSPLCAPLPLPLLMTIIEFPVPSNRPTRQTTHAEPATDLHAAKFSLPASAKRYNLPAGRPFLLPNDAARCHLQSGAEPTCSPAGAYFLVTYAAAAGRPSAALRLAGAPACGVAHTPRSLCYLLIFEV